MRLPVISNQTFQRQKVTLDGKRFENCKFIDCELVYCGGPVETSICYFGPGVKFTVQEQAATMVKVMQGLGWKISPPN